MEQDTSNTHSANVRRLTRLYFASRTENGGGDDCRAEFVGLSLEKGGEEAKMAVRA